MEKLVQMSHKRPSDAASVSSVPRNASTGSPECGQMFRTHRVSECPSRVPRLKTAVQAEILFFSSLLLVQQISESLGHEAFKATVNILKGFRLAQRHRRRD